jgi:hypothetical protein
MTMNSTCPTGGQIIPMTIDTVAEFWAGFDFDTAQPIAFIDSLKINCLRTFVNAHISYLKANKGNPLYLPYWLRLEKLTKHYAEKR